MYMGGYNLGNAAGEEVPDYNASIITSHSKERSKPTKKYLLNHVSIINSLVHLLNEQVTAIDIQSRDPSNSSG